MSKLKKGDRIIITRGEPPFFETGDTGVIVDIDNSGDYRVDFTENVCYRGDGIWFVRKEGSEYKHLELVEDDSIETNAYEIELKRNYEDEVFLSEDDDLIPIPDKDQEKYYTNYFKKLYKDIDKIIYSYPATIVILKNGTKGIVKLSDDDEYSYETGVLYAYIKAFKKVTKKSQVASYMDGRLYIGSGGDLKVLC